LAISLSYIASQPPLSSPSPPTQGNLSDPTPAGAEEGEFSADDEADDTDGDTPIVSAARRSRQVSLHPEIRCYVGLKQLAKQLCCRFDRYCRSKLGDLALYRP
jgi:hypothetical protein